MKNTNQNQSAITLIALIITIIVMLILAGVSLAVLTGENGIITRATQAKILTNIGQVQEYLGIKRLDLIKEDGDDYENPESLEGEVLPRLVYDKNLDKQWIVNTTNVNIGSSYTTYTTGTEKLGVESDLRDVFFTDSNLVVHYIDMNGNVYPPMKRKIISQEAPEGWIPIYTAEDLSKVGSGESWNIGGLNYIMHSSAKYILMDNIDLTGFAGNDPWVPIPLLSGQLNGNGCAVAGLRLGSRFRGSYHILDWLRRPV